MRQIWKNFCRIALLALLAAICVAYLAFPAAASSEDEVDESMQTSLASTADSLAKAIVTLSQEEIDSYKESGDDFTIKTMEVWEENREELGDFVNLGTAEVEKTSDGYSVRLPAEFAKQNAELIFLCDVDGVPTDFSIDVQYPMSVLLQRAGMNTLMGLGIVFAMLIFLTLVISLFRFLGKAEKEPGPELAGTVPLPVPEKHHTHIEQEKAHKELAAVIAAAIAAYEGTSTDSFVVRSIRKANRKKDRW